MNLIKVSNHLQLLTPDNKNTEKKEKIEQAKRFMKIAFKNEEKLNHVLELYKENSVELSGKLKVLCQLMAKWKEKGNKVLLFASKTRMLDILGFFYFYSFFVFYLFIYFLFYFLFLERFVRTYNYNFCRLDGNVPSDKRFLFLFCFILFKISQKKKAICL